MTCQDIFAVFKAFNLDEFIFWHKAITQVLNGATVGACVVALIHVHRKDHLTNILFCLLNIL